MRSFRIEATPGGTGSRIFVDDVEMTGVRAVTLRVAAGEATQLTIEYPEVTGAAAGEIVEVTTMKSSAREHKVA